MIVICLQADTSEMEINPRKTVCGCPSGGVMNSHTRNPLTVWSVFVSVHFVLSLCGMYLLVYTLSSHRVECICQCTVIISLCGMYLSVYSCLLTLWNVSVSVQLSSHCVECICQCTVVLSPCGMYLSLYSCPVTFVIVQLLVPGDLGVFSWGRLQQRMILEC